ncbi:aconitase family protein [Pseudomonas bharatica]|uniref:aconitase family protein n=1 Tax=Pseudomonas bharatica TaxID=2692112 RepID=UPI0035E2A275
MELIRRIGASGATGYAIEFAGPTIDALSVEGRMTLCNMAVESWCRVPSWPRTTRSSTTSRTAAGAPWRRVGASRGALARAVQRPGRAVRS